MRVAIIGAGPAGTVCALSLLREAEARGQKHEVLLFDGKPFLQLGPKGCNMCAGVIPGKLLKRLEDLGAPTPQALIQRFVTGHCFETLSGAVHIPKDPEAVLCTVFRGVGPLDARPAVEQSFDHFLLRGAVGAGATHLNVNVRNVHLPEKVADPFRIETGDGNVYESDVVVGAFGVNSGLARRFEELGFGYRSPETYHVCQAEFPLPEDFLETACHGEITIFSLALPGIRFGALTPKRQHVTVTIIGPHLKRAHLERFLAHPMVLRHFPKGWTPPATYCHCYPRLPVTAARNPVADRLIIIGDANISRYLKGGIESAFFTGSLAARMIALGKLSRRDLLQGYVKPCHERYLHDNLYGRFLFRCNDFLSRFHTAGSLGLQAVEHEQRLPRWRDRRFTRILWNIFSGDAPYRQIALDAFSLSSFFPVLFASARSAVRNSRRGGRNLG